MSEVDDDEEEGFNIPPISDILKDIPAPDPQPVTKSAQVETAAPPAPQESRRPIDPGETRQSIFTREIAGHSGKEPDEDRFSTEARNTHAPAPAGRIR